MKLTLEVVSANGRELGADRRKVFGAAGGSIGRASDCDWVLSNPYIHRLQAAVFCSNGTYYIESAGEKYVAVNSPQASLSPHEPRELRNGDVLYMDVYKISVQLEGVAGVLDMSSNDDYRIVSTPRGRGITDGPPLKSTDEEVDPLARLSGREERPAPEPKRAPTPDWNHTPGINDQFTPPEAWTGEGVHIPPDWNRTVLGKQEEASFPDFDEPIVPPAPPPEPISEVKEPRPATPKPGRKPIEANSRPEARTAPHPVRTNPPLDGLDVDAFFRAAGLNPADLPPETASALGKIMKTVVQGVVEVLQARDTVKDQFRINKTRIKLKKNNPLKFATSAENAMRLLLGHPDPTYMSPTEAFEDAMDDIRFHQLAMLAGMRAGFDQMLTRFDPAALQNLFDKRAKRKGLLARGAKARYWEMYTEEYSELTADPEAAFKRVFGEEFAKTYEKQLNTLKESQGKLRH